MTRPVLKSPPVQFRLPLGLYAELEALAHPSTPSKWVEAHVRALLDGQNRPDERTFTLQVDGVTVLRIRGGIDLAVAPVTVTADTAREEECLPVDGVTDIPPVDHPAVTETAPTPVPPHLDRFADRGERARAIGRTIHDELLTREAEASVALDGDTHSHPLAASPCPEGKHKPAVPNTGATRCLKCPAIRRLDGKWYT